MAVLRIIVVFALLEVIWSKATQVRFVNDNLNMLFPMLLFFSTMVLIINGIRKLQKPIRTLATAFMVFCGLMVIAVLVVSFTILPLWKKMGAIDFEAGNGYRIKAISVLTGYTDKGTIYELYRRDEAFPFLEHYIGCANNSGIIDYNFFKGKPTLLSTLDKISVEYTFDGEVRSDTLWILKKGK